MSNTHTVYGKYLLLDRIAVGGMAEVFKAKSFGVHGFERLLVIKRILPHLSQDQEFVQMFIDEAKIAVELTHANICQISDLGRISTNYFIAMEFINGKDLRAILKKCFEANKTIPIAHMIHITLEILKGLDYAHTKSDQKGQPLNLVHRDISPQNVMVSYHGEIKIVDFGIAKTESKLHRTQVGILKGKFGYMSPEQAAGQELDARTDLFSTAIILYECLTNRRLFHADTDFATLEMIRECNIPPPTKYNPEVPAELEQFLYKALAKEPADRFQNAHEMQMALAKIFYIHYSSFSPKELSAFMGELFKSEIFEEQESLKRAMDAVPQEKLELLANASEPSFRPVPTKASTPPLANRSLTADTNSAIVMNFDQKQSSKGGLFWGLIKIILFLGLPAYLAYWGFQKWGPGSDAPVATTKKGPKLPTTPVLFQSDPPGATVYVDEKAQGVTPVSIQLIPDKTYETRFQLEGYEELVRSEYITPGLKEASPAVLKKQILVASLEIQSQPTGATIFIDDEKYEKATPTTVPDLDPKKDYKIVLKKNGYEEFTSDINLSKDPGPLKIKLKKEASALNLDITPENATVTVNNNKVTHTIEDLTLGKSYDIVISAPGFITKKFSHVPKDREETISIDLKKIPVKMGTVNINAKPWASVVIDGKPADNTPLLNFDLPIGFHDFTFEHPDYERVQKRIEIKQGINPPIIIDFRKSK